ncbi:hypothetical protein Q3G72_028004 [Acer saccharum]|nr:hypothetical protein Q3G72_028004 [Acer saccharum]
MFGSARESARPSQQISPLSYFQCFKPTTLTSTSFVPIFRFSSAVEAKKPSSDESLIQIIDSESSVLWRLMTRIGIVTSPARDNFLHGHFPDLEHPTALGVSDLDIQ